MPRYLKETYRDDYNTLQQDIYIDLDLDEESHGMHSEYLRSTINPNLKLIKSEHVSMTVDEMIKAEGGKLLNEPKV